MRLLRLIRLVRLLKLLKELWILVCGMMHSMQILLWALVIIVVICYVFALFMYEMIGKAEMFHEHEEIQQFWGSIARCMLTLVQVATYDGAGKIIRMLTHHGPDPITGEEGAGQTWVFFVFGIFITVTSLGVLNLIVGVLLTAALQVTNRDTRYVDTTARLRRHHALRTLRDALNHHFACSSDTMMEGRSGSPLISRDMLLHVFEEGADYPLDKNALGYEHGRQSQDGGRRGSRQSAHPLRQTANAASLRGSNTSTPESALYGQESGAPQRSSAAVNSPGVRSTVGTSVTATTVATAKASILSHVEELFGHVHRGPTMRSAFEDAGINADHIGVIFNELNSILGSSRQISIDDFIEGCMWVKGYVHQIDVLSVVAGLKSMYDRYIRLGDYLTSASDSLRETSQTILPLLERYHSGSAIKVFDVDEDLGAPLKAPVSISSNMELHMNEEERAIVVEQLRVEAENRAWMRFDSFFGVFIVLNTILVGVQVSDPDPAPQLELESTKSIIWFCAELVFLAVFSAEFLLRMVLWYQIKMEGVTTLYIIIVPEYTWHLNELGDYLRVLSYFPQMACGDRYFMFDFFLCTLAWFDVIVLRFFILASPDIYWLLIFRVCRLLRLLQLARLQNVARELSILFQGFFETVPLLFWSVLMLLGVVYLFAIFMVVMVGKDSRTQGDSAIQDSWGTLTQSMMTLFHIATYNDWLRRTEEVSEYYSWIPALMFLFNSIAGFGILNLITGVMVQASFHMISKDVAKRNQTILAHTKESLVEAKDQVFKQLQEQHERKLLAAAKRKARRKEACRVARRKKYGSDQAEFGIGSDFVTDWAQAAPATDSLTGEESSDEEPEIVKPDSDVLSLKELNILLRNKVLMAKLEHAGLRQDQVLMVFHQLDVVNNGSVRVEEFIEGLLRIKQPVQGIDIAAAKSLMRRLIHEGAQVTTDVSSCNECFTKLVEMLRGVQVMPGHTDTEVDTKLEASMRDAFQDSVIDRQGKVSEQNGRLQRKIDSMLQHIERQKCMLVNDEYMGIEVNIHDISKKTLKSFNAGLEFKIQHNNDSEDESVETLSSAPSGAD